MPLDFGQIAPTQGTKNGLFENLLSRMSDEERLSFSQAQIDALRNASASMRWNKHPVDIRLSIPLLFARYYLVLLGGRERRSGERLSEERKRHPVGKLGNVIFIAMLVLAFLYVVIFAEAMILRAIIGDAAG